MLKQILMYCLLLVSFWATAQYSGSGPVTITSPSGASNIQWFQYTSSGPSAISGANSATYVTSTPGVYYAEYDAATAGCTDQQTVFTVIINEGDALTLDGATNNSGATSYQWKNAGMNISGAQSANLNVTAGGLYSLEITNATCTVETEDYYVFVLSVSQSCNAGTTAPILASTPQANICPDITVNLTTITASNLPANTTLTWHTGTPATTANKILGTAVTAGTYYAAFFDAANGCYSPTTLVTPTVANCVAAGTIDCSKTQITTIPVLGVMEQKSLVVTINVTQVGCFTPLSVSGSGMSLANATSSVCTTTTGIQQFVIPTNYDGTALGTMNFTVGSAGSCSADLTSLAGKKKVETDVWTLENCSLIQVGPSLK